MYEQDARNMLMDRLRHAYSEGAASYGRGGSKWTDCIEKYGTAKEAKKYYDKKTQTCLESPRERKKNAWSQCVRQVRDLYPDRKLTLQQIKKSGFYDDKKCNLESKLIELEKKAKAVRKKLGKCIESSYLKDSKGKYMKYKTGAKKGMHRPTCTKRAKTRGDCKQGYYNVGDQMFYKSGKKKGQVKGVAKKRACKGYKALGSGMYGDALVENYGSGGVLVDDYYY